MGGDLGFIQRGTLVPEYERVAFSLNKNEISAPIKTIFGYHLIQLLDKQGEKVRTRHILRFINKSAEDEVFTIDIFISDIDGDELSFWAEDVSNALLDIDGDQLAVTPNQNWFGQLDISIIVTDGEYFGSETFLLEIAPVNDAPELSHIDSQNIDEDQIKESLLKEKASPEIISKNLAELKANKVSEKKNDYLVLGADSVIDLNGELISKPTNRKEAFDILQKLNGQKHQLISSVCISKNGSMIWNSTDASTLTMKQLNSDEIKSYLAKIRDKELYDYGVYQIEANGRSLFSKIEGDEDTIMGLPVKQIKEYLNILK